MNYLINFTMQSVILAGGKGLRLSQDIPKSLLRLNDKTLLEYQLEFISPFVDKIVLALGYKADEVINFCKTLPKDIQDKLIFSVEQEPLGTGGALKLALQYITSEKILVFNVDDLTNLNLNEFLKKPKNTIAVTHPRLPFGLIEKQGNRYTFVEKPILKDKIVSIGWYLFYTKTLPLLPNKGNLEQELLPMLDFDIYLHEGFWFPINTEKDRIRAINELREKYN